MLLIQFKSKDAGPHVGILDADGRVRPIAGFDSTYALAQAAITRKVSIETIAEVAHVDVSLAYATIAAEGRLLPPLTHPDDAHCFVTGTGLTHLGSAESRNAMHKKLAAESE